MLIKHLKLGIKLVDPLLGRKPFYEMIQFRSDPFFDCADVFQVRSDPFYDCVGVFPNVRTIGNGLLDGHFSESNNIRVRNIRVRKIFFYEVLPLLFPHGTSVSRLSKLEGESTGLTTCKTGTVNEARTNGTFGRREKGLGFLFNLV